MGSPLAIGLDVPGQQRCQLENDMYIIHFIDVIQQARECPVSKQRQGLLQVINRTGGFF
jgi:hypothetical protein